ncbi:MAG: hypothetical protein ACP5QC_08000 [Caldimicrobium sp.]
MYNLQSLKKRGTRTPFHLGFKAPKGVYPSAPNLPLSTFPLKQILKMPSLLPSLPLKILNSLERVPFQKKLKLSQEPFNPSKKNLLKLKLKSLTASVLSSQSLKKLPIPSLKPSLIYFFTSLLLKISLKLPLKPTSRNFFLLENQIEELSTILDEEIQK